METPDIAIVSLLPSTTEICYALELGAQLRGVTHECDYPAAARALPHLTRSVLPPGEHDSAEIDRLISERVLNGLAIYDLDAELMAELDPDLVLTQQLCAVCAVAYDDVLAVAQTLPKVPQVASFEPRTVDEILDSVAEVARLAGVAARGAALVAELRGRLEFVARRVADAQRPRVVCLEWLDPPMVGGHWVPEMVRLAGGVDVLGPEGQPSIGVAWDAIVAAAPEIIVLMPCGFDLPTTVERARELERLPGWRMLRDACPVPVYAVDGTAYFNRPGPRVVDGVELLARLFHPERCADQGPRDAAAALDGRPL